MPPTVPEAPLANTTPLRPLGIADSPSAATPTRLPATVCPLAPAPVIQMPCTVLPETRLPAFAAVPPTVAEGPSR